MIIEESSKIRAAIDWSEFHLWSYRFSDEHKRVRRHRRYSESDLETPQWDPKLTHSFKRYRRHSVGDSINHGPGCKENIVVAKTSPLVNLAAGAFAGGIANYSTYWLDTVKVQMQCQPKLYSSTFDCFSATWRSKGLFGFYQGALPSMLGHMSKTGIVFMSYGVCENFICKLCNIATPSDLMLCHHASVGAFTGILASLFLCPLEVVKCRLQVSCTESCQIAAKNSPSIYIIKDLYRNEGIKGFYRGLTGIWTKEIPGSFIYFGSYECAKCVTQIYYGSEIDSKGTFLCGCWAGLCFCITHPIETVKSRIQVARGADINCNGFFKTAVHIVKNEGCYQLCSGLKPSIVRAIMLSGIQFTAFEFAKRNFQRRTPAA